jgi:hypothetical protein
MLALKPKLFLASGANRIVYRHPTNPRLCVKVHLPTATRRDESRREVQECKRLRRGGCDFVHLSQFHQWIATDHGTGSVWDLALNYDGTVAAPLLNLLQSNRLSLDECRAELTKFQTWCLKFGVITHDVHPKNLVGQFSSRRELRLVLVDGGGNNELIPVSEWFESLRQQKIARKWQRFVAKFDDMVSGGSPLPAHQDPCSNWRYTRKAA